MVVPSHPPRSAADKVDASPRRRASGAQAFVADCSAATSAAALEQQLADVLDAAARQVARDRRLLPAAERDQPAAGDGRRGAQRGAIVAFPAFADHQSQFRFLAGDPVETGPWACFQPPLDAPRSLPRPGPGAAGRDRPQRHAARPGQGPLRPGAGRAARARRAADRHRLGGAAARRGHPRRPLGRAARRLRLARRAGDVPMNAEPSWRKPAGIFAILALIVALGGARRIAGGHRSGTGRCWSRRSSTWWWDRLDRSR